MNSSGIAYSRRVAQPCVVLPSVTHLELELQKLPPVELEFNSAQEEGGVAYGEAELKSFEEAGSAAKTVRWHIKIRRTDVFQ